MERVTVVGASVAGLTAAETLRRSGYRGAITLLGEEPHLPYDRPPLSKQMLKGEWSASRLTLRPTEHFSAADVDLRLGDRATNLDIGSRTIGLADGSTLGFDGLIIATGVRPRMLADTAAVESVHVLRRVEDAIRLQGRLRPGRRLVVVGAGFIGAEVAATASRLGVATTLVEPAAVPLAHAFGTEIGAALSALHEAHGVTLMTGLGVREVVVDDRRACGVLLDDGTMVPADEVLVSIGCVPNTEWLDGSGLALGNGVVCDQYGRAADGVYAAGDVASWYNPLFEAQMRIEHRTNAAEQAMAVARNLLAGEQRQAFAPVPFFWSDLYDARIQAHGYLRGHDEMAVVDGALADSRFVAAYRAGDRLVGVVGMNVSRKDLNRWRTLIAGRASWSSVVGTTKIAAAVGEAAFR